MDDQTHALMIHTLVAGSIYGMKVASEDLYRNEPGVFPPVDDSVMFDVAMTLAATLIEANPDYADAKRLGKGADMVRSSVFEQMQVVRRESEKRGTKLLYLHMEIANGIGPIANDVT